MARSTNGTLVLRTARLVAGSALLVVSGAVGIAGCFFNDLNDCRLNPMLACYSGAGGSGGTGGAGGASACIPSEAPGPVAGNCGVFVSSSQGKEGNDGSKEKPFATLSGAIAKSDGRLVYACAEEFSESLVVSTSVAVYGGLDCKKNWTYVGATTKTTLTADADAIPLHVASTGDAQLEDFQVVAKDAATDGGSSIAVVAEMGSALTLARSDVQAGSAKGGKPGETPADPVGPLDPDDPAIKGNDGVAACTTMDQEFGGSAKDNALCPSGDGGPLGGTGGIGTTTNGGAGEAPAANAQTAKGGAGQPANDPMNMWSCATSVGQGDSGGNGASGVAGPGATALGEISVDGYAGESGKPGEPGKPGQGGGGGGGAKGKSMCAGASGGGGGAGGCSGKGGLGGQAGGSSIGIASLGATLTFTDVVIKTAKGGAAGDGGQGQVGGTGGSGGKGGNGTGANLSNACNGGSGGQGGTGGRGGGGRGGHSIGIAFTGAAPVAKGVTFELGTPGAGGDPGEPSGAGTDGVAAKTQDFGAGGK